MSVRYLRDLARFIIVSSAIASCAAAAGDLSPGPSAIEPASQPIALARIGADFGSSEEPFGNSVAQLSSGPLLEKWNAAGAELRIDIDIVAACRADPATCESPAAKRLIAIVEQARKREGRARIGEINRAVNLAIAAASDKIQYGVEDKWASPLVTFTSGRGDCEDYALAKYAALRAAGFDGNDLRLVIVRLPQAQTDHAVLSIRHEDRWLVLDNRRFAMLHVADLDAVPLFVLRKNVPSPYSTAAFGREPYLM